MSTTTICSWNINSLKVRQKHVLDYLSAAQPDVLGLQELKQASDAVDVAAFHNAGWQMSVYGQKTYNGVALISKAAQHDVIYGFPGDDDPQARAIAATINGIRVLNLYVPNGKKVGDEKYDYKLAWLVKLHDYLQTILREHQHVVVIGDFNIAPEDLDVHDPDAWRDKILCSAPERDALSTLLSLGFYDGFRHIHPEREQFSWWDYRMGGLRRNLGLRIDLNLCSDTLTCLDADIDMAPRRLERPSDHAPAWVKIEV